MHRNLLFKRLHSKTVIGEKCLELGKTDGWNQ